jgi:hypothetical protein
MPFRAWLWWLAGTPKTERRGRIIGFGMIGLVALAVAAPMFASFALDWSAFWERTRDTSLFTAAVRHHLASAYHTDDFTTLLVMQLRAAVTLFNATTVIRGREALFVMLGWARGDFEFTLRTVVDDGVPGTRVSHLLLEHARLSDERSR